MKNFNKFGVNIPKKILNKKQFTFSGTPNIHNNEFAVNNKIIFILNCIDL